MPTFTARINDDMSRLMSDLQRKFGMSSKAEVLRYAIALLKVAAEGEANGERLALVNGKTIQRVMLPPLMK